MLILKQLSLTSYLGGSCREKHEQIHFFFLFTW